MRGDAAAAVAAALAEGFVRREPDGSLKVLREGAEFAAKLETTSPKLLVRWTRDAVHVDMKTLLPEQDIVVSELFEQLSRQMEKPAGE